MTQSAKEEIKGRIRELKGEMKEKPGRLTNNADLTAEGEDENLADRVRKKVGQIEKASGN
jgi:uncharacterized protein YjbJ (UPF0337 family)